VNSDTRHTRGYNYYKIKLLHRRNAVKFDGLFVIGILWLYKGKGKKKRSKDTLKIRRLLVSIKVPLSAVALLTVDTLKASSSSSKG
jgi:hypothetical protein